MNTLTVEHAEEIWQHFKLVEVAFSIDDVDERFEYQRANAVWAEVNSNIDSFEAMRDRSNNMQLQVCSTVNVCRLCCSVFQYCQQCLYLYSVLVIQSVL